jgi:hypothetical protein
MGAAYALTAGAMRMNLVRLKGDQVGAAIEHFTNNMKRNAAMSDIPQTVEHSIQSTDKASRERIGRYTAVCGLAGAMIDAGNQYLDLNARRRATLEFYANGREPKGWSQRLPGPLKSILSESAWRNFEQVAAILGKEGIWHFTSPIPFDVVVVLPARVVWEIRKERVREQQAYRRGDVDELLDLADQLARASDGVDQLRGSITGISQAATAIKKVS